MFVMYTCCVRLLAMPTVYVHRQRQLCMLSSNMLSVISSGKIFQSQMCNFLTIGAQMGLEQCQRQFAGRHWNCSTDLSSIERRLLMQRYGNEWMLNRSGDLPMMNANQISDVFGGALKFSMFMHQLVVDLC